MAKYSPKLVKYILKEIGELDDDLIEEGWYTG